MTANQGTAASTLSINDLHAVDKGPDSIWLKYPSGAAEHYEREGTSWACVDDNGQQPTEEELLLIETDEQVETLWEKAVDLSDMR
jgi:hypothetical protein